MELIKNEVSIFSLHDVAVSQPCGRMNFLPLINFPLNSFYNEGFLPATTRHFNDKLFFIFCHFVEFVYSRSTLLYLMRKP